MGEKIVKKRPFFKTKHEPIIQNNLDDLCKNLGNENNLKPDIIKSYKKVIENAGFDINAGQNIDDSKTILELSKESIELLSNKGKGCCFHASMFLGWLLHEAGIECEVIITPEKTVLEDGTERIDNRASILVKDEEKYFVMNPVEDIEFFEENEISNNRENYYGEGTTVLKGSKKGISSIDAGYIDLDDFVLKYGNGNCWTLGNIFTNGNQTLKECFKNVKKVDLGDYKKITIKK